MTWWSTNHRVPSDNELPMADARCRTVWAISSDTSRIHPSSKLKAITRAGRTYSRGSGSRRLFPRLLGSRPFHDRPCPASQNRRGPSERSECLPELWKLIQLHAWKFTTHNTSSNTSDLGAVPENLLETVRVLVHSVGAKRPRY